MTKPTESIVLRGVRVHNLKNIDLEIPHGQSVAICGLSGSGKTSLALDTLYAEGQRRYIESFSAYTRQFLSVMEKPTADRIEGIPPAIAVTRSSRAITNRATVGSSTETVDYLREFFAKLARPVCSCSGKTVANFQPKQIGQLVESLPKDSRVVIGFSLSGPVETLSLCSSLLLQAGFLRAGFFGQSINLEEMAVGKIPDPDSLENLSEKQQKLLESFERIRLDEDRAEDVNQSLSELPLALSLPEIGFQSVVNPKLEPPKSIRVEPVKKNSGGKRRKKSAKKKSSKKATKKLEKKEIPFDPNQTFGCLPFDVVVDRLTGGSASVDRAVEAAGAIEEIGGSPFLWIQSSGDSNVHWAGLDPEAQPVGVEDTFGGRSGIRYFLPRDLTCPSCNQTYPSATASHFSYNSPVGACSCCEGFGSVSKLDIKKIVPDDQLTIKEGAILPWTTPKYKARLRKFVNLAEELEVPVNVPFKELTKEQLDRVWNGKKELRFGGLNGFFDWLQQRNYKMHYRIYLARWKSYFQCELCDGDRLNKDSLAYQVFGKNLADVCNMRLEAAKDWFQGLALSKQQQRSVRSVLPQINNRLSYLCMVGLNYVTLGRTVRSLSSGERQRAQLTTALGSSLVNMLYVLDEPSVGLHPRDVQRLTLAIEDLNQNGNTVVMVDHEPSVLSSVDRIVEIGPKAGEQGGEINFDGTLAKLKKSKKALTSPFVQNLVKGKLPKKTKKSSVSGKIETSCREPRNWVQLEGASANNLKSVDIRFPTGVLTVVTGVSGAGKSTLVKEVLLPGVQRVLAGKDLDDLSLTNLTLPEDVADVVLIDDSPIGKSSRSNPVTYLKAFDPIRQLLAATPDAVSQNCTAGSFSFNVDGGRCTQCKGEGSLTIDMQFMPDVFMQCPECRGTRYQQSILDVMFRGRNVHEILQLTVREAFSFFRSHTKVLARLQPLLDVGLDYVRLGQGAPTLSSGESQRLKLASYLSEKRKKQTLFIMDEPTTGLHPVDVQKLLQCFSSLLEVGHSLLVVEHNLQIMAAGDWMIDVGPESAEGGGMIVAQGTPSQVAHVAESITGAYLEREFV